jgi:hypothetical protein
MEARQGTPPLRFSYVEAAFHIVGFRLPDAQFPQGMIRQNRRRAFDGVHRWRAFFTTVLTNVRLTI